MAYTDPTVADFKAYFTRDFPYGSTADTINDSDITKAFAEAGFNFNSALFSTQAKYSLCFMYLTAHYLVMDIRASSQGISGSYPWMTTSKSVGSVAESFGIPQRIMDNPELAMYSKTYYGAKYLSLIIPLLNGQVFISYGATTP